MSEVIFVLIMMVGMIGPGVFIGLKTKHWHLLWVFLTFFVCFGFWEWHAVTFTDLSVSQQVWEFSLSNPVAFWICMAGLIIAWLGLIFHFSYKLLKKD